MSCEGHRWYFRMLHVSEGCYFVRHVSSQEPYKCTLIAHLVAVVRSREYSEDSATLLVFEAVLFALVGAHQHFYTAQGVGQHVNLLNPFSSKNLAAMSGPNWVPTPRLDADLPIVSWGSDQSSSHIMPDSGGSFLLSTAAICFSVTPSLEKRPP